MGTELSFAGKVAVVTGGAGGIGTGICQRLAEIGGQVVVTYNSSAEKAKKLLARLPGENHSAFQMKVDDSDSVAQLASQVREKYGRLDLLVNNAGMTRFVEHNDLDGLDDELIDQIFRVNWRGAFATVRALKTLLAEGDGGTIVNMSSIAGTSGIGSNIAYCASKAALDSMTRSLARALAPQIRVISVAPGLVDGEYARTFDSAWRQAQIDASPTGRLTQPEDVADAVLAATLLLPQTTGSILQVDGGRLLG